MPQTINVPGIGQLQFPDGMSQPDMAAAIQKNFPQIHANAPASPADQIPLAPGAAARMQADAAARPPEQQDNALGKVFGAVEPAIAMGTGMVGGAVGSILGAGKSIIDGHYGTQEGVRQAEETAGHIADAMTYQPRTVTGQGFTRKIGEVMTDSGIIGVPIPEIEALSRALPIARPLGAMRSPVVGAAEKAAGQAVNLDVPTYFRNGGAPIEAAPVAPTYTPSQLASEMERMKAQQAPAAAPSAPMPSPLPPPVARPAPAPLPPPRAAAEPLPPTPSPASKITEGLRDTSDIDGILQEFGVAAPEAMPKPPPEPMPAPIQAAEVPTAPAAVDQPFVATPEQHVNPAMRDQHLATLREIGLDNIRESAVSGDAAQAAREFQHGKITSEPAGQHWYDQFQAETDAMKNYGQRLVDDTKGRTGLDSESLEHKGRELAAPYDAMRKYFEDAKAELYDIADKAAAGKPLTKTDAIDGLLADRGFNNTALADKQLDLVQAVKNQFELHKERNEGLMTVKEAEDFRKWLNQRWTPDNSKVIGAIKDALDKDVFAAAGNDVYAAARKLHQDEMRVMDDPHGISKLMDSDPRAPINRATPYEAIPNGLLKLSNEQFKHIIDTYRGLPPELQPVAQQAIATLKSHLAERLVNTGTETAKGNPRGLWDAGGVRTFVDRNSAKLPMVFDSGELQRIQSLLDAGEILRVNPTYPGAAAQLANASKAGMMSNLLGRAGGGIGGMVGAFTGGPGGAAAGGMAGEAAASSLLRFSKERKALAEAKAAIINEHRRTPKARSAADEWEQGSRR